MSVMKVVCVFHAVSEDVIYEIKDLFHNPHHGSIEIQTVPILCFRATKKVGKSLPKEENKLRQVANMVL